jgi:hypothetical protein
MRVAEAISVNVAAVRTRIGRVAQPVPIAVVKRIERAWILAVAPTIAVRVVRIVDRAGVNSIRDAISIKVALNGRRFGWSWFLRRDVIACDSGVGVGHKVVTQLGFGLRNGLDGASSESDSFFRRTRIRKALYLNGAAS